MGYSKWAYLKKTITVEYKSNSFNLVFSTAIAQMTYQFYFRCLIAVIKPPSTFRPLVATAVLASTL